MKSNTLHKSLFLLIVISLISLVIGCPDPSTEERDRRSAERHESNITDNQLDTSDMLCETPENKKHLYRANHEFAEKWFNCSVTVGWAPPSARLKTECVKEAYTSMTDDCLECFNLMTACTASKCWTKCALDAKGQGCQECAQKECGYDMFMCSGVSETEIPDFKRN